MVKVTFQGLWDSVEKGLEGTSQRQEDKKLLPIRVRKGGLAGGQHDWGARCGNGMLKTELNEN